MNSEKLQYIVSVEVFANEKQAPAEDVMLFKEAEKAMHNAYAPYSEFKVGAAVLLENGEIIIGNNQENAAYPSGMWAERGAIYYASAKYPNVPVKAIAIICDAQTTQPVTPCGACRQSIAEYEQLSGKKIRLI